MILYLMSRSSRRNRSDVQRWRQNRGRKDRNSYFLWWSLNGSFKRGWMHYRCVLCKNRGCMGKRQSRLSYCKNIKRIKCRIWAREKERRGSEKCSLGGVESGGVTRRREKGFMMVVKHWDVRDILCQRDWMGRRSPMTVSRNMWNVKSLRWG